MTVTRKGSVYFASTSGMLCRSTTWLEKFSRHNAAVRLARTQFKYGRRVLDYNLHQYQDIIVKVKVSTYHSRPSGGNGTPTTCVLKRANGCECWAIKTAQSQITFRKAGF